MKLLRGTQHLPDFDKGVIATIGNFDGVHLGHQHLLHTLKVKADTLGFPLVVILFEPQPMEYFQKDNAPARLSSLREKLEILKSCQVDYVYCIKFDEQMAETEANDFACNLLFKDLKVKYLLVGEDFRFGKNRKGTIDLLISLGQQYGCEVHILANFLIENERISSTKIRMALQHGHLDLAAKYLGRTYSLCGRVIKGDGRGRQWGIPTANLSLHRVSLPLSGVFVVQVKVASQIVQGVANLGSRPTVDGMKKTLEVHLFDFHDSIYGELIQVFFLHKLRDEVKFISIESLIAQIRNDIAAGKAFFKFNEVLVLEKISYT